MRHSGEAAPFSSVAQHKPPSEGRPLLRQGLLLIFVVVWVCASSTAFYLKRAQLLGDLDGAYMLDLARRQMEWHIPLLTTSMDWFQGLGDIFFPSNFRILPSFLLGHFFENLVASKVVIYEVTLCELTLATTLFGLALGVSRPVALAAALATGIVIFPFASPTLTYHYLNVVPQGGSIIAATLATGAAYLRYGRGGWRADLPFAFIALFFLGWSTLFSITYWMLSLPFYFLCAIGGLIGADNAAERRCKIGLLVACLGLAVSPLIYLSGILLDTAAFIFPDELERTLASWYYTSILFHWSTVGPVGPVLVVSAIVGAISTVLGRDARTVKFFAITLLTYLCGRLTFAALTIAFDFWRGPAPVYFEFCVVPVYAIFAAQFFAKALEWSRLRLPRASTGLADIGVLCAGAVVTVVLAASTPTVDPTFPYPPSETRITGALSQQLSLRPGSLYRGRVDNVTWRSMFPDRPVNWFDLYAVDKMLAQQTGNELRLFGLNYFGIPTLFEYTPTISPFFYALTSRLLALPGDMNVRNVMVLRGIDPRIMAMLGIRFLIVDNNQKALSGYEINKTNVGDYSPTTVTKISTAAGIVARLKEPSFDPTQEVIADLPGNTTGYVAASNTRLTFLGPSLRLQSESGGESILLLPLEFSNCLNVQPLSSERPLLFRANLAETGILFSGKVDVLLSIRTGPFVDPACRLRDFIDARALNVRDVHLLKSEAH
jgi:hypothetical protein